MQLPAGGPGIARPTNHHRPDSAGSRDIQRVHHVSPARYGVVAHELLKLYAARGDSTTRNELCAALGCSSTALGSILDDVSERCRSAGAPDLSSLVNHNDGTAASHWASRDEEWHAERARCVTYFAELD